MIRPWVVLLGIAVTAVVGLALHGPIPQNLEYHQFADQRVIFGIPNFWNVISNVAFLVAGVAGLHAIARRGGALSSERAYSVFFASLVLLAFGSAYYHLAPDNNRLTWDRLPMAIGFMSFLTIVIGERISSRLAVLLHPLLLLAGAASVFYWHLSEQWGRGDLRPYLIVQFLTLVVVALISVLFRAPHAANGPIWGILAAYTAAKLAESFDEPIFRLYGVISGHTLKHLIVAGGMYVVVLAVRRVDGRMTERTATPVTPSPAIGGTPLEW